MPFIKANKPNPRGRHASSSLFGGYDETQGLIFDLSVTAEQKEKLVAGLKDLDVPPGNPIAVSISDAEILFY